MRSFSGLYALCAALLGLAAPALAQTGCPPGQVFIANLNRCIAASGAPNCPPGSRYSSDERRCLGLPQPDCPQGQSFDAQQQKCAGAPAAGAAPSK
jgi:hypothetical protein